ncbi:MAG: hypothetical protein L0323_17470 [Planctomycetes bacterium]|nr:hypothetical protein [Planctomycetota bacterium]
MIDLAYSRERMLSDIEASEGIEPGADLAGDRARAVLRRRAPEEILPELNAALSARFADVPPERLERDLLSPLKKAVGNAHKRGNLRDPEKRITVEVVLTAAGAFLEVCDEGNGFDVEGTLERFRTGGEYFAHSGSGFRKFTKARSVISFDRGGSRFRLRFLR